MVQARAVDIAVLVNLKARRGSERVARACRTAMPGARVLASRSLDEARRFARQLDDTPAELIVSAGGDGTAVALLNSVGGLATDSGGRSTSVLAALPLGTGNGWARVT